jgi:hypothetical protein
MDEQYSWLMVSPAPRGLVSCLPGCSKALQSFYEHIEISMREADDSMPEKGQG